MWRTIVLLVVGSVALCPVGSAAQTVCTTRWDPVWRRVISYCDDARETDRIYDQMRQERERRDREWERARSRQGSSPCENFGLNCEPLPR